MDGLQGALGEPKGPKEPDRASHNTPTFNSESQTQKAIFDLVKTLKSGVVVKQV